MDHPYFDTACIAFALLTPALIWWLIPAGINEWDSFHERRKQRQLDDIAKAEHKKQLRHEARNLRSIPKQRTEGDAS